MKRLRLIISSTVMVVIILLVALAKSAQATTVSITNCTDQGLADAMNTLNGTSGG